MLSSNQAELLRRLDGQPSPTSLERVAAWPIGGPSEYGENAARNALKRLEDRGLVTGSGAGRTRTFTITRLGQGELAEVAGTPAPGGEGQDSGPESATRPYVVLEQIDLRDITAEELDGIANSYDSLFVVRKVLEARNTEHAIRQTAREAFEDVDIDAVLVPVADRMWQPVTVEIRNRQSITVR